ncbi:putative phage tail component, N-terminal domain-containing protein [Streptococcus henryi]|uniref:Putative phage tail component, N-terminal domain-containing protein n=1 Tax=Streptococcus henryi TaxID=439219 RepID=A0A1G6AJV1_9STRE|nr:distal tail protein Dit [Streptococcus henryi]QBX25314.1 capsid and scaffold protein [Streptococcus phage Javan252]SDB08580.1 putative phage tail component, N-terminal domain-containing protein [Streptococcus henryi]
MSIPFKFNNQDVLLELEKFGGRAQLVDVVKNIASQFNTTYQEQGSNRYGQQFLYNTLGVKQITVSLKLVGLQSFFDACEEKLGGIINVSEPKELIFGREPNKVWEAAPSGLSTLAVDASTSPATAAVSLTFDVPKTYAENKVSLAVSSSNPTKYGSITYDSQGFYKAILKNLGTAETYPIISIKNNSENGYVGIVGANGVYAVGNEDESDTVMKNKAETLLNYQGNKIFDGFNAAAKNVNLPASPGVSPGAVDGLEIWGRRHLELANGTHSRLTWTIPTDSEGNSGSINEDIWWRQVFWCLAGNEQGALTVDVWDENNNFMYGVQTTKNKFGLESEYVFYVIDGNGNRTAPSFTKRKFLATHRDHENPFNHTRGASAIHRRDDKIKLYWWGGYIDITCPALKGKKSAKISVTFQKNGNAKKMSHMYFDEFYYRKNDVAFEEDFKNLFAANSITKIDFESGKVYNNDIPIIDKLVDGSEPFPLVVGESEVDFYLSSWVQTPPEIIIEWKERYV